MTPPDQEPLSATLTAAAQLAPGARHQELYRYAAVVAQEAEALAASALRRLGVDVPPAYPPLVRLVGELAAHHAELEGRKAALAPGAQASS